MQLLTFTLVRFITYLVAFSPVLSYAAVGAPAWLESAEVDRTIYVNNGDPNSSDKNPGTADLPLNTISAAANLAVLNRSVGFSSKIVISPGVYREQIHLRPSAHKRDALIIFEAKEIGKTVISGSDLWTGWEPKGEHNYVLPWTFAWGLAPYPRGWEGHVKMEPIVRRREMVFINGTPLDQALSLSNLRANSFYVSEPTGELYVHPPRGINPNDARVEVAIRSGLFFANTINNVVLRGLVFQHDTSPVQDSAVLFSNSQGILLEQCEFLWNSWTGLGLNNVRNVTVRSNVANRNGGSGWTAWRVHNMLSDGNETSFNNWRGERGGFLGWAVAGLKHLQIHEAVYTNHIAQGNRTRGVWFDFDNTDISLEGLRICGNLGDGIDIEASQGPITIKHSRIDNNNGNGIFSTNSHGVKIEDSFIQGNKISPIKLSGEAWREVQDWQTKRAMTLRTDQWALKKIVIKGSSNGLLLDIVGWPHFLNSLVSDENTWISQSSLGSFKVGSSFLSFPEWQELTKQETHSTFRKSDPTSVTASGTPCM